MSKQAMRDETERLVKEARSIDSDIRGIALSRPSFLNNERQVKEMIE